MLFARDYQYPQARHIRTLSHSHTIRECGIEACFAGRMLSSRATPQVNPEVCVKRTRGEAPSFDALFGRERASLPKAR